MHSVTTFAASALATACIEPDPATCASSGPVAAALLGGSLDASDPAVVAVNLRDGACRIAGWPHCTGALIASDRVLTAAHCVADHPADALVVVFGATAELGPGSPGAAAPGVLGAVAEVAVDPGYQPASLANDLALLRLTEPVAVPPLAVVPPDAPPVAASQAVRLVGFGVAEASPLGAKRTGPAAITSVDSAELIYRPDPAMTCAGDSGGPVLIDLGEREAIAGVTSRGDLGCVERGVAVRVDAAWQARMGE